jgi:small-conductance mechanosensitive channel
MRNFFNETRREIWIALILLYSFFWIPALLRYYDNSVGAFDLGELTFVALGAFKIYLSVFVSWGVMKLLFPSFADYAVKGAFKREFNEGSSTPERWRITLITTVMLIVFLVILFAFLFQMSPMQDGAMITIPPQQRIHSSLN